MKNYIAELVATYFLVFCGTGAIVINDVSGGVVMQNGIAISFGVIVTVMIFAFGRSSGAHMNPAVSIALASVKLFPKKEVVPYILAQLAGAVLASLTLKGLFSSNEFLGSSLPSDGSALTAFILEFILTFLLMMVILFTTQGRKMEQYFAPIAIGLTVLMEAQFAGPICGASMNPARSFGPALISGHTEHLWVYLLATTLGAIVASGFWWWQTRD
jgi:aquaporin Z